MHQDFYLAPDTDFCCVDQQKGLKKGQQRVTEVKGKEIQGVDGDLKEKGRGHIVQVLVLMHVWLSVLGHRPVSLITS